MTNTLLANTNHVFVFVHTKSEHQRTKKPENAIITPSHHQIKYYHYETIVIVYCTCVVFFVFVFFFIMKQPNSKSGSRFRLFYILEWIPKVLTEKYNRNTKPNQKKHQYNDYCVFWGRHYKFKEVRAETTDSRGFCQYQNGAPHLNLECVQFTPQNL